jgi:LysR family transcriptional regulator, transcriptional activator of the cysJI operon
LTLRHFQIFVAVCNEMNMTAAAGKLFMSQSAVSQAIAELETYYHVRLFERLSKKLFLTKAGEKLLGYAQHIIGLNRDVEREMHALNENLLLRLGASVTIGACVLPKMVSDFMKVNPGLTVEVTEDNTAQIEQLLVEDKIDLGLVEGEITLSNIISQPFTEDTLVLICGNQHPFSNHISIPPGKLENENFILREVGSGTRKTFEDVMLKNSIKWKATWTCNNADTIKMAVSEGLGVSVISKRAVLAELQSGVLHQVQVDGLSFQRQFKLAHHKNKFLTEVMEDFMVFAKKHERRDEAYQKNEN